MLPFPYLYVCKEVFANTCVGFTQKCLMLQNQNKKKEVVIKHTVWDNKESNSFMQFCQNTYHEDI